ncbi:MAG: hypothetical protein KF718_21220 [Polyangiaceae bacterium]|nr:hypothetical protein [Polyangiaceae bacterium]
MLTGAGSALAEPMDPALERLVVDSRCRTPAGAIVDDQATLDALVAATGRPTCTPDHAQFKRLMSQYGFAFAPTAMHSARTTGFGGFHLSLEAAYTSIDDDASYWEQGTQGSVDPSSKRASIRNTNPSPILSLYSAKIRKSFGFGLEITGAVGFMPKTSILSGGADVRLSLLEGFRTGAAGVLPDIAVGGGVRTVTGTPQFQMTVVGLDAQISKPLPIADSSIITPWVGYQYAWIFADSGLVDLTPGTDAIGYCNFAGPNVPGNPDPNKPADTYDGQPVCNGGDPRDFNNNVVFNKARLERQRLMFGVNYRYEMVMIGGQFITDIVDPADAQNSDADKKDLQGTGRQWTIVLELGAMF